MAADVAGADANGDLMTAISPPRSGSPQQKRKWEDNDATPEIRIQQLQLDLLDVLRPLDVQLSFLSFNLAKSQPMAPSPKKMRATGSEVISRNIGDQLSASAYESLHNLKDDILAVGEAMKEVARIKEHNSELARTSVETLKQVQRIESFVRTATTIIDDEHGRSMAMVEKGAVAKHNGGESGDRARLRKSSNNAGIGSVLTLFGNAPTPRQLFSSMQSATTSQRPGPDTSRLGVEEMGLPIGLSTTIIYPSANDQSQRPPSLAESFPPPHGLQMLLPPKAQRRSSTRDATITWEFKDSSHRTNKRGGYTVQNQTAGSWLGYGGVNTGQNPTSPREKRKQRDRALSSGEVNRQPQNAAALAIAACFEERALFRRAYSSFAPSYDDSRALVSCETKNMIWWEKTGDARYEEKFAYDPALMDSHGSAEIGSRDETSAADLNIDSVVSHLDDGDELRTEETSCSLEVEDEASRLLRKISQLLETLASHQHIRNATLPTSALNTRPPLSPAPLLASKIGQPDAPAEEEVAVAERVRHELAYLLLQLPPYAVAKLDGEQFEALGVSRLIPFVSQNVRGTLEEDHVARFTKHTAAMAANRSASTIVGNLHRSGTSSGQHYNSTAQRTPAIGQAANTRYGQQYGTGRTPAGTPQIPRTSSHGHHGSATMSMRPGYTPSLQHGRQGVAQYGQQYAGQRPPGLSGYGNSFQHTPQPNTRPNYALSQQIAQYQQRPSASGMTPTTSVYQQQRGGFDHRTASPAKSLADYGQMRIPGVPRPNTTMVQQHVHGGDGAGSGMATPNYSSQPLTPVNGYRHRSSQETPQSGVNGRS